MGRMRGYLSLSVVRVCALALWLVLAWIFQQTLGNVVANFFEAKLLALLGVKETAVGEFLGRYLAPLLASAVIIVAVFLLGKHERLTSTRDTIGTHERTSQPAREVRLTR
jgi:hypothetical protein